MKIVRFNESTDNQYYQKISYGEFKKLKEESEYATLSKKVIELAYDLTVNDSNKNDMMKLTLESAYHLIIGMIIDDSYQHVHVYGIQDDWYLIDGNLRSNFKCDQLDGLKKFFDDIEKIWWLI